MSSDSPLLSSTSVLVVDTDPRISDLSSSVAALSEAIDLEHVASYDSAERRLLAAAPAMVLVPVDGPDGEWRAVAAVARESASTLVLVDPDAVVSAEEAVELGATDHVRTLTGDRVPLVARRLASMLPSGESDERGRPPRDVGIAGLDSVDDLVYLFDTGGTLRWWNRRLEEVTGHPRAALVEMSPADFFDGADRDRVAAAFQRAVDGERVTVEADIVTASGATCPYELTGTLLERPGAGRDYVIGLGRDVSARVERLATLQSMERQMEAVFNDPLTFAAQLDGDGRLQDANSAALQFVDATIDEVRGEPLWKLPWWTHSERMRTQAEEAVERAGAGEFVRFEANHRRHDGVVRTFDCSIRPVRNEAGTVTGLLAESIDITEREDLRTELDETLDRISDALFAVDSDWHLTYVNGRALELTGMTEGELLGESFWKTFPATLGTKYERAYREAMRTQETTTFEEYYDPLDMWTEVRVYPSDTGLSIYYQDVTEQHRTAQERQLLGDTIRIAAGATSFEQALEDVLHAVCGRTELEYGEAWVVSDDVLSNHATYTSDSLGHELDERFVDRTNEVTFERGEGLPGRAWESQELEWMDDLGAVDEAAFVRHDAVQATALRSAVAVPIATDDEVVAVLTFFLSDPRETEDRLVELVSSVASELGGIMARQRTADRLSRERNLQERVFDTSPVGIAVTDATGNIIRSNDRLEEVLQLSTAEITSRTFAASEWNIEGRTERELSPSELPVGRVLATGEPVFGFEHTVDLGGGTQAWVRVNAMPLFDDAGDVEYVVSTVEDITQQLENERQLERRSEQLSVVNRILRHDLRTHANVILGYSEMLREGQVPTADATAHIEERIDRLVSTSRKARHAVEHFDPADTSPTPVRELVENARESLAKRVADRTVDVSTAHGGDVTVEATAGLQVAIVELLENAVEHTGEGDTVRIETGPDGRTDEYVTISIVDDGPGIPDPELQALQADVETPMNHSSGLGIRLARWLVDAHDGHLEIAPGDGGGTTCRITLPVVPERD